MLLARFSCWRHGHVWSYVYSYANKTVLYRHCLHCKRRSWKEKDRWR